MLKNKQNRPQRKLINWKKKLPILKQKKKHQKREKKLKLPNLKKKQRKSRTHKLKKR